MITQAGSWDNVDDKLVAMVKQGNAGTLQKLRMQAGLIDINAKELNDWIAGDTS